MAALSDPRLLVADDNPDNRDVLIRRLRRLGYTQIESAVDGQQALEMNEQAPFDAILLDVMMPRMNGLQVLERLNALGRLKETPVIMISAATELDTVVRCLQLGAEDYLQKPFNPQLLKARLGSVLEKHRLARELRHHSERLDAELAEARQQQLSMVPTTFPRPRGPIPVEVYATMRPAREIGGDFYDCFEIDAATLCFAVGDVSGKGVPAALFMARARSLLRASALMLTRLLARVPSPGEVAAAINEELCKNNPICNFVTMFIGIMDTRSGDIRYINGGHVYPCLLRDGAAPVELVHATDLPLGFEPGAVYRDATLALAPGDALVIVSDGVHDMETADGHAFGRDATLTCLAGAVDRRAVTLVTHLTGTVTTFSLGAEQADDVTVLALRRG